MPSPEIALPTQQAPYRFPAGSVAVAALALVRVILYFVAAPHYGYFRDEMYYLACGEHPAWGYMDQPPLIAWIAWLLQHTIGTSLYALRLLPMLADIATIVLTAHLVRKLGGRAWAVFLAGSAMLIAPVLLASSQLFTMNAFDPLLWTLLACLLVDLLQTGNQRIWLGIGALIGITLLNKYGILFLLPGLLVGVVASPLRRSLVRPWFWAGVALATLIALPNFLWQLHWNFPFLQQLASIRRGGRDVALAPLPYLALQAQVIGYFPALLVVLGLVFLFSRAGRRYALLGFGFVSVLGLMLCLKGKFYYVAPVYPLVFAPGAVLFEQWTQSKPLQWVRPAYALLVIGTGVLFAPAILPILSIPQYIAYTKKTGIDQPRFEHQQESPLPQIYADMVGWEERVRMVAAYFHSLPLEEQKITAIGAPNYGQAGAIDLFGPKYGLPKAISAANNYWIWGPRDYSGQSLILLDENLPQKYVGHCQSLVEVAHPIEPYARPDENLPIYHCRGLHPDLKTFWPTLKPWK